MPRARVRDNQFAVLTADPVVLASLIAPRVACELSSVACASVRECCLSRGRRLHVCDALGYRGEAQIAEECSDEAGVCECGRGGLR
jgi:hypothetical protein